MLTLIHEPAFFIKNIVSASDPETVFNMLNLNQQLRQFWLDNRDDITEWYTEVVHIDTCRDYELIIYQSGRMLERKLEYYPNTNVVKRTEIYENEKLHGATLEYDRNGKEISRTIYVRGQIV